MNMNGTVTVNKIKIFKVNKQELSEDIDVTWRQSRGYQ